MRVTTRYMGELRVSNHEKQSCFAACLGYHGFLPQILISDVRNLRFFSF